MWDLVGKDQEERGGGDGSGIWSSLEVGFGCVGGI